MKSIPYEVYVCKDIFNKEKNSLFSKLWLFACTWPEISNPDRYVSVDTPMGSVIVTSDGKNSRAFFNKCLHRGHKLKCEARGQAKFVCPYHGWQYDSSGRLKFIPGGKRFYVWSDHDCQTNTSLQTVSTTRLGDFIFINTDLYPLQIEEQFNSRIISSLIATDNKIGSEFLTLSCEQSFNWKLIAENLRDGLHPGFLHNNSLINEVDFKFVDNFRPRNTRAISKLIDISSFSRDGILKNVEPAYKSEYMSVDDENHYMNWLLFPYTHIASPDGGTLFGVENYVPISSERVIFKLNLYITKNSTGNASSPKAILYHWLRKAEKVFKEDFEAVTSIQEGLEVPHIKQNLGKYEDINCRVYAWLKDNVYA